MHPFLQKLLAGQAVEWKPLGEIAYLTRGKVISKQYLDENRGNYPVYSSQTINNGEIGKIDTFDFDGEYVSWTTDGANAGTVFYRTGKFSITNVCGLIQIKDLSKLDYKFLFYWLSITTKQHVYSGMGNPKLMSNQMSKIKIPIPPLSVQTKIAQILDIFTAITAELTAELNIRNQQYQYYRDKLLSENELAKVGFEWKTLKEVSLEFGRGKSKHRPRNDERLYGGDIPFIQTGDIRGSAKKIKNYNQTYSDFGLAQSKLWKKNTLCITIAANIAETAILDFDACFPDSIIGFIADPKQVDVNYIYYLLQSLKIKLQSYSTGSAQENINLATFEDLLFPIPPLAEQARIVAILDKFDTLTQSITEGLPREIELRQQQYEYYREALLSFNIEN